MKKNILIPRSLLKKYISGIVSRVIAYHDYPLENSSEFEQSMFDDLTIWSNRNGDREILLLGVDYLLSNPHIDTTIFQESEYPWSDEEMRRVILEIRKRLWPDQPMTPEDVLMNIELTNG